MPVAHSGAAHRVAPREANCRLPIAAGPRRVADSCSVKPTAAGQRLLEGLAAPLARLIPSPWGGLLASAYRAWRAGGGVAVSIPLSPVAVWQLTELAALGQKPSSLLAKLIFVNNRPQVVNPALRCAPKYL